MSIIAELGSAYYSNTNLNLRKTNVVKLFSDQPRHLTFTNTQPFIWNLMSHVLLG